jgi:hypothetical protein
MVEEFPAKSGDLTASAAGVLLHSRYDPRREAHRYVSRSLADVAPATLLLLGTGLGYVVAEARTRFPRCRIIAASSVGACREEFQRAADVYLDVSIEQPEAAISRALAPEDVVGLELLEWEPDLRSGGELGERARHTVREVVSRLNADIATTGFFGRRYLRNAVRTALFMEHGHTLARSAKPVCVAASGPSLERAAEWIRANRSTIELWALSSAAYALEAQGVRPDLLVHQDAGYYATLHLRFLSAPVLMPTTAALPGPRARRRPVLFTQATRIEGDLLEALDLHPVAIPETATVAATATALALAVSSGPVYLAGLDLCREDIRAHARPHAFEPVLHARENRMRPYYSQLASDAFDRSVAVGVPGDRRTRTERSLDAYAHWFRSLPEAAAGRLRRIEPSPVDIGVEQAESAPPVGGVNVGTDGEARASAPLRPLGAPTARARGHALLSIVDRWRAAVSRVVTGDAGPGDGEIAYVLSAPDYVASVAASRRGDTEGSRRSLERLEAESAALFDRLELVVHAASRPPESGGGQS